VQYSVGLLQDQEAENILPLEGSFFASHDRVSSWVVAGTPEPLVSDIRCVLVSCILHQLP
jgi:hypothetical protein